MKTTLKDLTKPELLTEIQKQSIPSSYKTTLLKKEIENRERVSLIDHLKFTFTSIGESWEVESPDRSEQSRQIINSLSVRGKKHACKAAHQKHEATNNPIKPNNTMRPQPPPLHISESVDIDHNTDAHMIFATRHMNKHISARELFELITKHQFKFYYTGKNQEFSHLEGTYQLGNIEAWDLIDLIKTRFATNE